MSQSGVLTDGMYHSIVAHTCVDWPTEPLDLWPAEAAPCVLHASTGHGCP